MIQIPKSISPVAAESITAVVKAYFPCSSCLEDFDDSTVNTWRIMCNYHELFDQDAERLIGDVFAEIQRTKQ